MNYKIKLPFLEKESSYYQLLNDTIAIDDKTRVLPSGNRIKQFHRFEHCDAYYVISLVYAFHCYEFERFFRKKQSHFFCSLAHFAKNPSFRKKYDLLISDMDKTLHVIENKIIDIYPDFLSTSLPTKTQEVPIKLISAQCTHWFLHIRRADLLFGRIRYLIKQNCLLHDVFYHYYTHYTKVLRQSEIQQQLYNSLASI